MNDKEHFVYFGQQEGGRQQSPFLGVLPGKYQANHVCMGRL
jgi:hypothetical protein